MDNGYETTAPQWTDFSEITPNRDLEGDEFFDRIHESLEVSSVNPGKRRNHLREKVNIKNIDESTLFSNISNHADINVSEIESKFMNDIDKIRMTPIKVTSPRTKNKEPVVMQELSVNEILTNAIKGLEIASSTSKNHRKSQILNATVCPSSITNAKITSSQRKLRISRSMHTHSSHSSNGKTPAAKAATTLRNLNIPKVKVPIIKIESELYSTQPTDIAINDKISTELDGKCEDYIFSMNDNSAIKDKTPVNRPEHENTSLVDRAVAKNTNIWSHIIKTPKLKLNFAELKTTDVKQKIEHDTVQMGTAVQAKIDSINKTADERNYTILSKPQKSDVLDEKSVENASIDEVKIKTDDINEIINQHDDIEEDFQVKENFKENGDDNNDDDDDIFQVHYSNNMKHHNHRNEKHTVLTNPARRHSILNRRRRSNKYISFAEAVSTFQRSTPTRFHTVSSKSGPVGRIKQQTTSKCTIPISPALMSKTRVRRNGTLNQTEREKLEIKNIEKHQVYTNSIRPAILAGSEISKVPSKKPPVPTTSAHPQITRVKRVMTLTPSEDSQTMENHEILNFGIPAFGCHHVPRQDLKKKITQPQECHRQLLNTKQEKSKLLQNEKVNKTKYEFHARPVPAAVKKNPKITMNKVQKPVSSTIQIVPFSFEERDKLAMKKKEKLRQKIEEEERKARIFHANPAPLFKPVTVRSVSRENLKSDIKSKSSENMKIDGKINNPGKSNNVASMTRHNSADYLQPSTTINNTRHQSVENLKIVKHRLVNVKSNENINCKLNDSKIKLRKNSVDQIDNQENRAPNISPSKSNKSSTMPTLKPKLKTLPIELHSDKRARMRREYDEKMRIKLERDEQRRKKEEESKLAREQAEIAEIRKKAEIKARPMPVYKTRVLAKSTKPLTEAESPAWSRTKR